MLSVIVLLEVEHSAQSEVLNALDLVFIKAQYFGALSFSSTLTSPSVPAAEKQPHSTLYFWDGTLQVPSLPGFPSNMVFGIEVHQTRESLFSESEGPLGVLFANYKCFFHVSSRATGISFKE